MDESIGKSWAIVSRSAVSRSGMFEFLRIYLGVFLVAYHELSLSTVQRSMPSNAFNRLSFAFVQPFIGRHGYFRPEIIRSIVFAPVVPRSDSDTCWS